MENKTKFEYTMEAMKEDLKDAIRDDLIAEIRAEKGEIEEEIHHRDPASSEEIAALTIIDLIREGIIDGCDIKLEITANKRFNLDITAN